MIVALLVLIVLILLFGAGVVKGWIANAVGFGCGGLLILVCLMWVGSFFGENGFRYIFWGILSLLGLLALAGIAAQANEPTPASRPRASPNPPRPAPTPRPKPKPEPLAVEKVWGWYAHDIALRFSTEAREKARKLYDTGDAHNLDRFCRAEIARLK